VTTSAVEAMRPGSVIVDLAAETGGNCELTVPGEIVDHRGVTILGLRNLPSTMPQDASLMLSRNIEALLRHLVRDGNLELDFDDEITRETCVAHAGKVLREPVAV
jgi:proton-translocating NAD(P)+ transhydrogenase subunit alpha